MVPGTLDGIKVLHTPRIKNLQESNVIIKYHLTYLILPLKWKHFVPGILRPSIPQKQILLNLSGIKDDETKLLSNNIHCKTDLEMLLILIQYNFCMHLPFSEILQQMKLTRHKIWTKNRTTPKTDTQAEIHIFVILHCLTKTSASSRGNFYKIRR